MYYVPILLALPAYAQIRGWRPSALFGMTCLSISLITLIEFGLDFLPGNYFQPDSDPNIHSQYFVVISPTMALIFPGTIAFFYGLTRVQERLGIMRFPRCTRTLFWVMNTATWPLTIWMSQRGLTASPNLTDLATIQQYLNDFDTVANGSIATLLLASTGLIVLAIWSMLRPDH